MSTLAAWIAIATLSRAAAGPAIPDPVTERAAATATAPEVIPDPIAERAATTATAPEVIPVPAPASAPAIHPLRVRWGITAPLLATTGLGFALMEGINASGGPPEACSPPVEGTCPSLGWLEPIDRIALDRYDGAASTASDVFVALALLGPAVVNMAESIAWSSADRRRGSPRHRRRGAARFGYDSAIWAEAIGVAMVTTDVFKAAFDRPRPLVHQGEPQLVAQGFSPDDLDGDLGRSFPSGHATLAFASVVAGATLLTLKQCRPSAERWRSGAPRCEPRTRRQRAALGLMWGLGLAGAVTTATLRVVAGKHYPSDVLMGSAIGITSGVAIPLLHRARRRHAAPTSGR